MDKKQPSQNRNYKKNSGSNNKSEKKQYSNREKKSRDGKGYGKKSHSEDDSTTEKRYNRKRNEKSGGEGKSTYRGKEKQYEDKPYKRERQFDNKEFEKKVVKKKYSSEEGNDAPPKKYIRKDNSKSGGDYPKKKYYSKEGGDDAPKKYYKDDNSKSGGDYPKKKYYSKEGSDDAPKKYYKDDNRKSDGDYPKKKYYSKEGSDDAPKKYYKDENRKSDDDFPKKKYYSEDDNNEGPKKIRKYERKRIDDQPERSANNDGERGKEKRSRIKKSLSFKGKGEEREGIRLNKYIANAGICSRREADEMIRSGVISVNGEIVTELGIKVMPGDVVKYDNRVLKNEQKVYVLLNKPKDYLTTTKDPQNRKTVMDLVRNACKEAIYPVGRLDRGTTGLLLFTNDGEMAEKLMHPKNRIRKVYQVSLDRPLTRYDLETIAKGVELEDGLAEVDVVVYVGDESDKKEIGIELHSGKNRIVRRIFEHLGYKVQKLDRVVFAGLTKKDLPRGRWRFLAEQEVNLLHRI